VTGRPLPSAEQTVKTYFDRDAAPYQAAYERTGEARGEIFRERRRLLLERLKQPPGRVLDIGAGPAVFTEALLALGAECWTMDLSREMIRLGRQSLAGHPAAARAHHGVGEIGRLPFSDSVFDAILCSGVLQYLPDIQPAIREMARTLRPGGQILLTFPNNRAPLNSLHRAAVQSVRIAAALGAGLGLLRRPDEQRLSFRADIPNRFFSAASVTRLAREAGLAPQGPPQFHCHHFPFQIPALSPLTRAWDRIANLSLPNGPLRGWGREGILELTKPG